MQTLTVELAQRSYPVYIGEGLLANVSSLRSLLQKHVPAGQVLVVSNERVASIYLPAITAACIEFQYDTVLLPEGEENKTLTVMAQIFDTLIEHKHRRSTTLIALGGGVIGDMTGFAAACYQRGVNFIQIPTTLLAQVDASIGGKTAVNHALGKNMIGAFYQPRCVIIDVATLTTLNDREFSAGLAEIIKAALIQDADFFHWLEQNMSQLMQRKADALIAAIERACAIKAKIVAKDETENAERALLNLGHTFGHAIEQDLGYGHWLHGEAVAVGLMLAADLSVQLGWITAVDAERIRRILILAQLPICLPTGVQSEKLLVNMQIDKKATDVGLHLILLKAIGRAVITAEVDSNMIMEILRRNIQR